MLLCDDTEINLHTKRISGEQQQKNTAEVKVLCFTVYNNQLGSLTNNGLLSYKL